MIYLAQNLKYLRKRNKISQQQLADAIDTPRSRIAAYESKNVEPRLGALITIADYFEISLDRLVTVDLREESESIKENQVISPQSIKNKCERLEKLIEIRSKRLHFLWQEQEKVNPTLQTALSELKAFELLSNEAIQLCKNALN